MGESRVLGGVHFRKAVVDGGDLGRKVGLAAVSAWLLCNCLAGPSRSLAVNLQHLSLAK